MKSFNPVHLKNNPVMFITEIAFLVSIYVLIFGKEYGLTTTGNYVPFYVAVLILLFLTIFFSNLAESIAEGKSRDITKSLREMKKETVGRLIQDGSESMITSSDLRKGMIVEVRENETVPTDGEIMEGRGRFNESSITGESRPVFKVQGDSVTGGTTIIDGKVKIMITANPGETFLDKMIEMVEGATRSKTPNEIALSILLSGLTLSFLIIVTSMFSLEIFLTSQANIIFLVTLLKLSCIDRYIGIKARGRIHYHLTRDIGDGNVWIHVLELVYVRQCLVERLISVGRASRVRW